jgi:hypothetical protein
LAPEAQYGSGVGEGIGVGDGLGDGVGIGVGVGVGLGVGTKYMRTGSDVAVFPLSSVAVAVMSA